MLVTVIVNVICNVMPIILIIMKGRIEYNFANLKPIPIPKRKYAHENYNKNQILMKIGNNKIPMNNVCCSLVFNILFFENHRHRHTHTHTHTHSHTNLINVNNVILIF